MDNTRLDVIARDLLDAFNAADWERFRSHLLPNSVYMETGSGRRVEGADAYVELCQGWKAGLPDATGVIRTIVTGDNCVVEEVNWTGTQTGPLVTPGGTLPPSGKRTDTQATLWLFFEGDKVKEVHHHIDIMMMMVQLGALPDPSQT